MDPALLHAFYAFGGLLVGLLMTAFGLFLAVRRSSASRKWCIKLWHFEIRDAEVGIAFAFLGVVVIIATRL